MSAHPTIRDIRDAAARVGGLIHRTPVMTCASLDRMCGAELFFKCENFQKSGSFKIRGATNAVFSLTDGEAGHGVATHSSGNHAAALALAAAWRGIRADVVMPEDASSVKRDAVTAYGAEIHSCPPTLEDRERTLERLIAETGAVFIHPYNDLRVICGQGTAALELLEEVGDLDTVMAPVGGGGLLSGTAIAVSALSPGTKIIGAEPRAADDAHRALRAGRILPSVKPRTIADGLLTSLGELTFPIIRKKVEDIVTVSEEAIVAAMRAAWERMKIVVEPSAAVPLGAVLSRREAVPGRRIGVILSGGNVDLSKLPW
jgi:threonine dehydratase